MQFHRQLNPHIPEIGLIGDCFRTCIACMLNLHPSEVPNFSAIGYNESEVESPEMRAAVQTFLKELGLTLISIPLVGTQPVEAVTAALAGINGDDFCYMLSGKGVAGHGHVCIYRGADLLWCPSGSKGIVSGHDPYKEEPSFYWVMFLGSLRSRYSE